MTCHDIARQDMTLDGAREDDPGHESGRQDMTRHGLTIHYMTQHSDAPHNRHSAPPTNPHGTAHRAPRDCAQPRAAVKRNSLRTRSTPQTPTQKQYKPTNPNASYERMSTALLNVNDFCQRLLSTTHIDELRGTRADELTRHDKTWHDMAQHDITRRDMT